MSKRTLPVGVYMNGTRYHAIVRHNKKRHYLGTFSTAEEAGEKVRLFRKEHPKQTKAWMPGDDLNAR